MDWHGVDLIFRSNSQLCALAEIYGSSDAGRSLSKTSWRPGPFLNNNLITVVLGAVLAGAALRRVKDRQEASGDAGAEVIEQAVHWGYQVLVQMLTWIVQAIPFAVFGVVAQVVACSGLATFSVLWIFLVFMLLGLGIHSLIYYPAMAWLVGNKPPRVFFSQGADAILTGIATNSSLAAIPVTLRCLTKNLGVSEESARLSACVGTNLNHDGRGRKFPTNGPCLTLDREKPRLSTAEFATAGRAEQSAIGPEAG
jgi:L-cystine uptake protein TcyP (sodium:dicarboxylate symporter family)